LSYCNSHGVRSAANFDRKFKVCYLKQIEVSS
jgi:hypothetical protein